MRIQSESVTYSNLISSLDRFRLSESVTPLERFASTGRILLVSRHSGVPGETHHKRRAVLLHLLEFRAKLGLPLLIQDTLRLLERQDLFFHESEMMELGRSKDKGMIRESAQEGPRGLTRRNRHGGASAAQQLRRSFDIGIASAPMKLASKQQDILGIRMARTQSKNEEDETTTS